VPFSVKAMSSKWTSVGVSLIVSFAIDALESMRA